MGDSWIYTTEVYKTHRGTDGPRDLYKLMTKLGCSEEPNSAPHTPAKGLIPSTAPWLGAQLPSSLANTPASPEAKNYGRIQGRKAC